MPRFSWKTKTKKYLPVSFEIEFTCAISTWYASAPWAPSEPPTVMKKSGGMGFEDESKAVPREKREEEALALDGNGPLEKVSNLSHGTSHPTNHDTFSPTSAPFRRQKKKLGVSGIHYRGEVIFSPGLWPLPQNDLMFILELQKQRATALGLEDGPGITGIRVSERVNSFKQRACQLWLVSNRSLRTDMRFIL